ncbi:hypothetical protein BO85DRAFT_101921 [Aspergillus piperis CBS 112811]|uniref:Uncharacterized protein n=1 Tax=Aspergillus piperis CBS 112811 TaxID=1448313 RepID=A0A8G1VJM0_9EURO|nr:hypothetical protein BO85DRAFT_101921 [Aspergillus piperis CBS 112811]RAH54830.1 hypothetical protein BO85DRAFT_101921 [Aspergillus piperis CBS 112811]
MVWWQYVVVAAVAFRAPSDDRRGLLHDMRFSTWGEVKLRELVCSSEKRCLVPPICPGRRFNNNPKERCSG